MKYVKKDDIIRMSQMYDCSCEVGTSRSIACFTSIYLQTVVDFVIGSFNEFKCLRKKFLVAFQKQASCLCLNIVFYMLFLNFDTITCTHEDWYLWHFVKPGGVSHEFRNKYYWLISLYESVGI